MKKILYSVMALAIAAMTFTACEDVPEPYSYPVPKGGTGALPYQSANLNTGWTLQEVSSGAQPWSKGNSYAQATGYQAWDGASSKSNKAVEGWLVSPAISTVGYENVKLSFNHTIKYTNNVTGWEANHKVYVSTSFDGTNANTSTWKELEFKPVASPYSDWTLYSSGEIQLPTEFVGKEAVFIGFWFKAPDNASTTWELQSFKMVEGIAEEGDTPDTPDEGLGTAEAPLTVSKALEIINGYDNAGESKTDAYVKGIIVSVQQYNSTYKSITYYISDDGTATKQLQVYSGKGLDGADFSSKNDLKPGAVVVVKGKLKKYVKDDNVTPEINQSSTIVSIEGNEGGDTPQGESKGDGTLNNPFNAVAANAVAAKLGDKEASTDAYYIKGKVAEIKYNYGEGKYPKTADFYISDDGTTNNTFYVYAGKYLGNKDYESGDVLKVGDEVIIYGNLYNYGGTYETAQGKAYLYSLNGKTESSGGTPTPQPGGEVKTVTVADFNAAAESNDVWYQLTGTVKNLKDGDQYGNFDLEDATGSVYVYGLLSEKGGEKKKFQELVAAKGIKNGCTLTIIGTRGSYNDKIEVTNAYFVSIEGGDTPGGGGGGDTPGGGGTTVTSLTNGDFEAWSGNQPTGWKSASTASSATLAQSTDAHGGSYSVNVNGKESSNVRLASQEITLAAGTYVFSFYAKATTADASQVRPGYVPVADGKVGSYAYGNYATLSNTSWTQVTHEFTLDAETTVCLVVMNPKKSEYSTGKDVLVDDATLTKK